jgi:GNAT superfamily N-acetyltransferase
LSAFSVGGDALPEALQKKLPRYGQIPCTLLGRLAVDVSYAGRGLGSHLLVDALTRAVRNSKEIASWAVIVDAKDAAAITFHAKHGFISFPLARQKMFLPIATAAESLD